MCMGEYNIKIGKAVAWVAAWFGVMLFYTLLDVAVWRKILPRYSDMLNLITIIICVIVFLKILQKEGYQLRLFTNVTVKGVIFAVACSFLFFVILDNGLDPVFESLFPQSEEDYKEMIQTLLTSPVVSFIQVCMIAPFIEEILMRDVVLGGLRKTYGTGVALFISAFLFALLHFNMVQTLSAFVCGIVLGMLYLKTDSILCCIIAHCGYNLISYISMIYTHIDI